MNPLKAGLEKVARTQKKFAIPIFIITILFTLFISTGLSSLELQTDFNKEMPQDLPIMILNQDIRDTFSGQDSMIVILNIDKEMSTRNSLKDIRDMSVVKYLDSLEEMLMLESGVSSVFSLSSVVKQAPFPINNNDALRKFISKSPARDLVSKDYETTVMFITADVGTSQQKIINLDNMIKSKIDSLSAPPGVNVMVTGTPQITVTLFDLLGQDAVNTILYASAIILLLLFIIQRSFTKGILVFAPLGFGLIWTYGTLGLLGMKISIATAGLGAIILGLGVEYGIFMMTRYKEERNSGKSELDSLKITVPSIGSGIIGSATTTIVGFLALTTSVMPLLQNLGFSLALGIFYSMMASVFVMPVLIILEEKLEKKDEKECIEECRGPRGEFLHRIGNKFFVLPIEKYSYYVSHHIKVTSLIVILLTIIAIIGAGMVGTKYMNNRDVLAKDLEVIRAFNLLEDNFGSDQTLTIAIRLDTRHANSNEVRDLRESRAIEYIDLLGKISETSIYVDNAQSIATMLESANGGILPKSEREIKTLIEQNPRSTSFLNEDYSFALITLTLVDVENSEDIENAVNEVKGLINSVDKPPGIISEVAGELAVRPQITALVGPDIGRTSQFSLLGIIVISFLLFFSFRYGITPLSVIFIGIIWAVGILGLLSINLSAQTSGVISMIMGIGIDFGIQMTTRFREEVETKKPEKAMETTISNVFVPMTTTTLAALIGFRAMSWGQLTLLGELGDIMSIGIFACFIAAITIVPVILVGGEKLSLKLSRAAKGPSKRIRKVLRRN